LAIWLQIAPLLCDGGRDGKNVIAVPCFAGNAEMETPLSKVYKTIWRRRSAMP